MLELLSIPLWTTGLWDAVVRVIIRSIQAFGWFVLVVFLLANGGYLLLNIAAITGLRSEETGQHVSPVFRPHASPFMPGVAAVVPAYNEATVIVDSVQSLRNLTYPNLELVVVNDGSSDDTLERLIDAYELTPVDASIPLEMPCEPIRGVYRAPDADLVVIDKENGGKADALNAGVWYTDQPLFCAVDADSILERDSLYEVVKPFLRDPDRVLASGGVIRVANGCSIERGVVKRVGLSSSRLVRMQTMEYLRAFLVGRLGLSRLGAVPLISGAFGVFRTDAVREVGGYPTDSITEDLELVLALNRHFATDETDYRVVFVSFPVVWTEVPESLTVLSRQRRRWFRGLLHSLWRNRSMIGRPTYGRIGLFALPFFLIAEVIGPLTEALGYIIVPIAFLLNFINLEFFLLFLAASVGLGSVGSALAVYAETRSFRRYTSTRDILTLLAYGVLEHVLYRQWKAYLCWKALLEYVRGDTSWGEMTRTGFKAE